MNTPITILDHENRLIAENIYSVFQLSYAVEAKLLGAADFPPLKRTVPNFLESRTSFFGYHRNDTLVGIIEIDALKTSFHICSLVVHPDYFRQGIAQELLNFIFRLLAGNNITVETGLANDPAVKLYKGFGFKEVGQYNTDHGIRKIKFERKPVT
jgi:ribosomal protein S18 acetylase RimI-like enzyme